MAMTTLLACSSS